MTCRAWVTALNMMPLAKAATADLPGSSEKRPFAKCAAWLIRSRHTLDMTQCEMATLLGYDRRTYERWESGRVRPPFDIYFPIRQMLDEAGLDSCGKIKVA